MKFDLHFWTLILKWGVIIRYFNFLVQRGEGFKKKMTNFLLCAISPAKIIFILETVKIVAVLQIFFTVKVGGKMSPPPFMDGVVPNQKYQPYLLRL